MKRLLLAVSFLATTAHAADLTNFERILFPAWIPTPIAGAAGSRWTADATIHNPGPDSVAEIGRAHV